MHFRVLPAVALTAVLTMPLPAQPAPNRPAPPAARGELAAAQAAAWGRAGSTTYRIDNENVSYAGGRLLRTRFGPVLVAEGRVKNFGHPSPGRIGAFYLKRGPGGFARGRAFPSAVTGGSMGGIGEWSVSDAFAAHPVIYTEGGMSNMGSTCSYVTLTELTPAGPIKIAGFQSYGSYAGGVGGRAHETKGRIANIVRGRSFDVVFTGAGARPARDRYVRVGNAYRLAGGKPTLDSC